MTVKKNDSFGVISIKKFIVSEKTGDITLVGDVQADYLKPFAGTLENDVCRMVPWSVGESYWANSNRVYLGDPKINVGTAANQDWVEVDSWVDYKVPKRTGLQRSIFTLLKGCGEFDGDWSARSVKRVYDIINVGTAANPKSELKLRGKAKVEAKDDGSQNCPF